MDTPIFPRDSPYSDLVYEPAEDSFFLLDVLEADLTKFYENFEFILSLEMGCGSGSISTAVSKFLYDKVLPYIIAIDVNPAACYLTKETSKVNGIINRVEPIIANGLKPFLKSQLLFDLVICNPPYVPIFPSEATFTEGHHLEKSWDGGPDGNSFIIPFLKNLSNILAPGGALYILMCSWNNPEKLLETYVRPQGYNIKLLEKRVAGRERLSVWRIYTSNGSTSTSTDKKSHSNSPNKSKLEMLSEEVETESLGKEQEN